MFVLCYGWSTISVTMVHEFYLFSAPWFASFLCSLGFIPNIIVAWCYQNPEKNDMLNPRKWIKPIYIVNSFFASGN